ncbi:MAG: amino acid ABC transporter ATP-binding protein [Anaerolineae bacterium]|jgi:polar amino acid transport system ATP-binding protein|nr:amino acid ABC transporter ATP-binding protein [Anaerolineae bacterium]
MNLDVRGLTMTYEEMDALDNLTIQLTDIQSLVIIGPSGGGKSTFLRVLAGLEKPSSGEVNFDGTQMIFEEKWLADYRKGIGVVFQAYNLFPHWTSLQNIVMPLVKVHGETLHAAEEKALALMNRFGLAEHAHKIPAQLSGGQQQRIAIARAMAINPNLLLLDEPTSALDPQLTNEVLEMVLELQQGGMNLILVTHEMAFARRAAEHVLYISHGKVVEHGSADEIFIRTKSEELRDFLNHT